MGSVHVVYMQFPCATPIAQRVDTSLIAQYNFNDRYVNPSGSPTVAKNTAGPFPPNPPPFTPFAEISNLVLSNASYWCQNHAGLCISPLIQGKGWPAGTPVGDQSLYEMAKQFQSIPFQVGMTVELWFRKTVNVIPHNYVPFVALTACEGPTALGSIQSPPTTILYNQLEEYFQNPWTLVDCNGGTPLYNIPTRAYITDAGNKIGACSIVNNDLHLPWLGSNCAVGYMQQMNAVPADFSTVTYPGRRNTGLHYYVHTIAAQSSYGCEIDGYYQTFIFSGHKSSGKIYFCAEAAQDFGTGWTYMEYIDGVNPTAGFNGAFEGMYDAAPQFIHSMWNMFAPDLDWGPDRGIRKFNGYKGPYGYPVNPGNGETCAPNLWRAQIRQPQVNCMDPPPAYGGSMGLKFGNWNPASVPPDLAPYETTTSNQWQGEILYFAIHLNTFSPQAVKNNYNAGPPNTPPVNQPVVIHLAYCQLIVNFQLPISDYDITTLQCPSNQLFGIVLGVPSSSLGTLTTNFSAPITTSQVPYRFPAKYTLTFVLNNPPPLNPTVVTIPYNSDDNNGGGAYAKPSSVTINIPGATPPSASDFIVFIPFCTPNSTLFNFKVSQPISTQCNTPLNVVITNSFAGFYLFQVISPTRLIPVNTFPFTAPATATFMVQNGDLASFGQGVQWFFHANNGIESSGGFALGSINIATPLPPVLPRSSVVRMTGCSSLSNTFSLSIQAGYPSRYGTCGQLTIQFTQPPTNQGTLYYQTTSTGPFVVVPSTSIAYSSQYNYRFQLPDPRLSTTYTSFVLYTVTDSSPFEPLHSRGNISINVPLLPAMQKPNDFTIRMKQCDLVSSTFLIPVSTNNSLYVQCLGGLNFTILTPPPNPITQGTLAQSRSGLAGTFTNIQSNTSSWIWTQRYEFTPPPYNSVNLSYTWTYEAVTSIDGIHKIYSPVAQFTVIVNASDAPLPKPTTIQNFYVQAGQFGVINMTGIQGGCPSQNNFFVLNALIVTPHAGASPTQNGSLFFYDPSQPNNVGPRIPSAGIVVQLVTGTVNGIMGTYPTYVDASPGLFLVYGPPFPTGSALQTKSNILGHDSFYFFLQNGQRISSAAGKIQITIINPLQGVSQVLSIDENTLNTPLILRGINVPTGAIGVITNLTGLGTILFHALPISYPFSIAFEPGTNQTPPNLVYNPPANVSGNAVGIVHFYMTYPGGLQSPFNYTITFNILNVNQPPWFEITPLPPVSIQTSGASGGPVSNVTQGTSQAFNVTLHSLEFPLMPYTLTISVSSPSLFSLCCQIDHLPYRRIVSGATGNSTSLILYAQKDLLNSFMTPIVFTMNRLIGGPPILRQYISFTVNDNNPTGPLISQFILPVDVKS